MSAAACRPYLLRPVAGAEAPARARACQRAHIRPSPTSERSTSAGVWYGLIAELGIVTAMPETVERFRSSPKRAGNVFGLSPAKVDQSKCGRPIFGTLTYPADFPLDRKRLRGI